MGEHQYRIGFDEVAEKHLGFHYKSGDRATIKRIERIIAELEINPYEGIGNPYALKHDLSGCWSRHLNKKDVMIYEVLEETLEVHIISALGHYLDK